MNKERFCSTCYSYRNAEDGKIKQGTTNRWICKDCATKIRLRKPPVIAAFAPKVIKYEEWRFR